MTDLLEKAFANASKLPPREQDVIAKWLLAEIEVDARWDQGFAKSHSVLATLASEALKESNAGDTMPLIPDEL